MHPHLEIILLIKIKEKTNTMHQQNSSNFLLENRGHIGIDFDSFSAEWVAILV
jgi:hypothetical protein